MIALTVITITLHILIQSGVNRPEGIHACNIKGNMARNVMMAAIRLVVFHIFHCFTVPKKQNISPKMFTLVLWIVPVTSILVAAIEYPVNLGYQIDITFYMELLLGVLFVIIGNYLPKARQNYTIGIRIPWTLANEENWNRTHRLAGYLWMIGGILMIIACLSRLVPAEWLIGLFLIMALVPCIYSYWLHAKKGL